MCAYLFTDDVSFQWSIRNNLFIITNMHMIVYITPVTWEPFYVLAHGCVVWFYRTYAGGALFPFLVSVVLGLICVRY